MRGEIVIDVNPQYAGDDRPDERLTFGSIDKAALELEELVDGLSCETARDDLTHEEKLTYESDGRVVTVTRAAA